MALDNSRPPPTETQQRSLETGPPAVLSAGNPEQIHRSRIQAETERLYRSALHLVPFEVDSLLLCFSSSSSHVTGYQETAVHGGALDTSELLHLNHYFTPLKSPQTDVLALREDQKLKSKHLLLSKHYLLLTSSTRPTFQSHHLHLHPPLCVLISLSWTLAASHPPPSSPSGLRSSLSPATLSVWFSMSFPAPPPCGVSSG